MNKVSCSREQHSDSASGVVFIGISSVQCVLMCVFLLDSLRPINNLTVM